MFFQGKCNCLQKLPQIAVLKMFDVRGNEYGKDNIREMI
jgi:hypothetical protein